MLSANCAIGPDGQLLDASQISWDYDPDPLFQPPNSSVSSASRISPAPNAFDMLISNGHTQASSIAGQRRSNRTRRPTEKVREGASDSKRKASPGPADDVPSRKIVKTTSSSTLIVDETTNANSSEEGMLVDSEESGDCK
jgi:hypothetical protein